MEERIKGSSKWGTVNGEGHEKGADEKGEGEVTVGTVEGNGVKKKKNRLNFLDSKEFPSFRVQCFLFERSVSANSDPKLSIKKNKK